MEFWWGYAAGLATFLLVSLFSPGEKKARATYKETHLWLQETHGATILRIENEDKLKAVAARMNAGLPVTFRAITGKGKLFRKSEWVSLRKQLRNRGLVSLSGDGSFKLTPYGRKVFNELCPPPNARTGMHG